MDSNFQRPATGIHPDDAARQSTAPPPSWADSLADLVVTRIALIQAEAKQAAANRAVRFAKIVASVFLVVCAWLLLMAAAAGLLHAYAGFAWYWGCLSLGGIHLLGIAMLLRGARSPGQPAFQHTLSEFQKDREWLKNLKNTKSGT